MHYVFNVNNEQLPQSSCSAAVRVLTKIGVQLLYSMYAQHILTPEHL